MKKLIIILLFLGLNNLFSARIKDIAVIEGFTETQVIGYGLVSGLNQSGDNQQTSYTVQSVSNMLKRFGLTIPSLNPRVRNVAAVMVTANIPPFAKKGSKVDVVVSSIGDAQSLQGGVLLMTPISRVDGSIVGMAQGPLSVGGYDFNSLGSRTGKNITTTGRVPNGLIMEDTIGGSYISNQKIRINLRQPDFTTALRVAQAVNGIIRNDSAVVLDAATVEFPMPSTGNSIQNMTLISQIESANIISDPVGKVVINERTGTIVIGGSVQLLPATIAHGGLEIIIQKQVVIAQPAPFTIRPPRPVETAEIKTNEEIKEAKGLVVQGATVEDMARALNVLKVNPRDLISIFQALKESGSLQGELVIQ